VSRTRECWLKGLWLGIDSKRFLSVFFVDIDVFPELLAKVVPVVKKVEVVPPEVKKEPVKVEQESINRKWMWLMLPGLLMYLVLLKLSSRGL
jgi:hypothetical protein